MSHEKETHVDSPREPHLPFDEKFTESEQFVLDHEPPRTGQCPHHKIFVYGCNYCDPH